MLSIKAFAKINLYLDVLSRYNDGYHQIESVMQSVSLFDLIEIHPSLQLDVICSNKELESKDNISFKAAKLLKAKKGVKEGAVISIVKQIPVAAGLAGGSADAAATLIGLNEFWNLGFTTVQLQEIGLQLGADVPFCCEGGTILACGKGEKLSKLTSLPPVTIVIVTLPIHVSTAEIYRELDNQEYKPISRKKEMIEALSLKDNVLIAKSFANALETVALKRYPEINHVKEKAIESGCIGTLMSGSGPSVFAFYKNRGQASIFVDSLKSQDKNIFIKITESVEYGAKIL